MSRCSRTSQAENVQTHFIRKICAYWNREQESKKHKLRDKLLTGRQIPKRNQNVDKWVDG